MCNGIVPTTPVRSPQSQGAQAGPVEGLHQDAEEVAQTTLLQGIEGGGLMPPPQGSSVPDQSLQTTAPNTQLERRKSVRDLVTDFSSCVSSVSSGEDTIVDWAGSVTRRKKKKRKASNSPIVDSITPKYIKT